LRAVDTGNTSNWMSGLVDTYTGTTLTLTIDLIGPSPDTASDWSIALTGEKGDTGPSGGFSALLPTKGNLPIGDGTQYGALTVGTDGTIPLASAAATFGIAWSAVEAVLGGSYWKSTDVASAATCDIGAVAFPRVRITGTTTITSFGTSENCYKIVTFAGSLILTYNGTSLILPGGSNIVTQAGDTATFVSDASGNWACVSYTPVGYTPRERLTGNRTYYVRGDGNDANNGLTNTSGGAFATLARAFTIIQSNLDLGGYTVTIQKDSGTHTGGLTIGAWTGGGSLVVDLGGGTVSTTSASAFTTLGNLGGGVTIQNGTLQTTTSGQCIAHLGVGSLGFGSGLILGACAGYHIQVANPGSVFSTVQGYTVSGGALAHYILNAAGAQMFFLTGTITFTAGKKTFSNFIQSASPNFAYHTGVFAGPTCTITIASPGVVTKTAHALSASDPVIFNTSGALPTGLTAGVTYFVKTALTADTFTVSATAGGAEINTTGSQSGTHNVMSVAGNRYAVTNNAVVQTNRGANHFPGSAAGSATTGLYT
jgi:hypothetical protein